MACFLVIIYRNKRKNQTKNNNIIQNQFLNLIVKKSQTCSLPSSLLYNHYSIILCKN